MSETPPRDPMLHSHAGYPSPHSHPGGNVYHHHGEVKPPVTWQPPTGPNVGADATRGLVQGFAGCLGVGIAIGVVLLTLAFLARVG